MNRSLYFNWNKVFSYNAFFNVIIGGRGIGKTYGLRLSAFHDFINSGDRFAEICRVQDEVTAVGVQYFSKHKITGDLIYKGRDYTYKYKAGIVYIAESVENEKNADWKEAGYVVALSAMQKMKKQTFVDVRKIIFDEAIIDRELSPFSRYLNSEYNILLNTLSTLLRETPEKETKGRVYLLGNAVDLLNPYFGAMGIKDVPKYGFTYNSEKDALFCYYKDRNAGMRQSKSKLAKLMDGNLESRVIFGNEFRNTDCEDVIEGKPAFSRIYTTFSYKEFSFTVWQSRSRIPDGILFYIEEFKSPEHGDAPVFTFELMGVKKDTAALRRNSLLAQQLIYMLANHRCRFSNYIVWTAFHELIRELQSVYL